MLKLLQNNKGVTLVEVVIALALLVILFVMFGMILTTNHKASVELNNIKNGRESLTSKMEYKPAGTPKTGKVKFGTLSSDGSFVENVEVGKVLIDSHLSEAELSTNPERKIDLDIYQSEKAYGTVKIGKDDPSGTKVNKGYLYTYSQKHSGT